MTAGATPSSADWVAAVCRAPCSFKCRGPAFFTAASNLYTIGAAAVAARPRTMTAPEPWRGPPPEAAPRQRRSQHPLQLARDQHHTDTELGFGAGLVATHLNGRPPSQGGIYMPKAPRVDPPRSGLVGPGSTAVHPARRAPTPASRSPCRTGHRRRP